MTARRFATTIISPRSPPGSTVATIRFPMTRLEDEDIELATRSCSELHPLRSGVSSTVADESERRAASTFKVEASTLMRPFLEMLDQLNERLSHERSAPSPSTPTAARGICGACSLVIDSTRTALSRSLLPDLHARLHRRPDDQVEPFRQHLPSDPA